MRPSKIGMAAVSVAAVGALALGGAALANAADSSTPSSTATTGPQAGGDAQRGGPMGASTDTTVTGAEADKVIAAVKAKDSAATITAGAPVFFDVSADLKTVTANTGGPGGGKHGGAMGGTADAAVTGAEADKVIAAVKAKDSAATITAVRKDPDGSYDALGTKAGAPVFFDVSADLKTVTANTGGPGGGHGGPGGPGAGPGTGSGTESGSSTNPADANGSTATS
jgi:hypothetical protein